MSTCARCDRQIAARGLCNRHYLQARKHGFEGVHHAGPVQRSQVEEMARTGSNPECVDCADVPLFGGLRCLECFQLRCDKRRHATPHKFVDPPSYGGYVKGCRCGECRSFSAYAKRRERAKTKVAA
jgi:hypothetical protein